jgi:segregation and condensation protein B
LDRELLQSVLEGLIFASPEPVPVSSLAAVIPGVPIETIQAAIDELHEEYRRRSRGFALVKIAGGYQFRTLPSVAPWITEMRKIKPARLSRAALETLSIIAYNQPVTRSRIEQVRGVESSAAIKGLLERELIVVVGKKDVVGRPLVYGTAPRFLEVFGLSDLSALPPLPELEELDG